MWTFLLLYASLYATSSFAKKFSSLSSNSVQLTESTTLSNSTLRHSNRTSLPYNANKTRVKDTSDRHGYQKDLMVVLPVMQGVSADLDSSNLQILYTKPPVTAIIDDKKEQKRISPTVDERIHREKNKTVLESAGVAAAQRHPYTEFLANKTMLKMSSSPLDYGYPESFKFVQEFNDLPKNHKPGWASTNQVPDQTIRNDIQPQSIINSSAASVTTKDDPFQMFEFVKPMEINKIFADKPSAPAAVSENVEETTSIVVGKKKYPEMSSKRPFLKRIPTKKPSRNKTTNVYKQEKIESIDLTTMPAVVDTNTVPLSSMTTEMEPELYTAARYSTLFAESTKHFLPTPNASPFSHAAEPFRKPINTTTATPTTSTRSMTSTDATTRSTLSDLWKPITVAHNSHSPSPPSDSSNLGNILLGGNLAGSGNISFFGMQPLRDLTTRSPVPNDRLTNNMKNMLISLGILKSEDNSVPVFAPLPIAASVTTASTTTEQPITKPKPIAPIIDPDSYSSFKKIPINSHPPKEQKSPPSVSDDMRELLSSFGLLPTRASTQTDILTRISRQQHKLEALLNETNASKSNSHNVFPNNMETILDNLGLLQPLAYHYNPQRAGHVFQPTTHLEKLGDEQKVQKINEVIDTIRRLSKNKDIENLSIEELEKQLENVTAVLNGDTADGMNVSSSNTTNTERMTVAPSTTTTTTTTKTTTRATPVQITTTKRLTTTKKPESEHTTGTTTTENDTLVENSTKNESSTSTSFTVVTRTSVKRRPTTTPIPKPLVTVTPVQEESSTSFVTAQTTTTKPQTTPSRLPPSNETLATNDNSIRMDESSISVVKFFNATKPKVENVIMTPPNPLSPDELLQLLEFNKNDVKRQQPNETANNSSMSTTENISSMSNATLMSSTAENSTNQNESTATSNVSESSTRSSTMDEQATNVNSSVPDLTDSFGGGGDTTNEDSSADDLPTPRPNGLYFYLDWNTFLNVGEANGNPIRIRFSPRAGNPRLFLPITVP